MKRKIKRKSSLKTLDELRALTKPRLKKYLHALNRCHDSFNWDGYRQNSELVKSDKEWHKQVALVKQVLDEKDAK